MGYDQWMNSNKVVHERGKGGIVQNKWTILKYNIRLQMNIGRRVKLPEDKQLSNQWWRKKVLGYFWEG